MELNRREPHRMTAGTAQSNYALITDADSVGAESLRWVCASPSSSVAALTCL